MGVAWSPPHAPHAPLSPSARRAAAAAAAAATAAADAADAAARRSFRAIQDEEEAARRRGLGRLATDRLSGSNGGGGVGGGSDGVPVGGPPPAGRWFRPDPPARKPLRAIEAEERAMEALRRAHPGGVVIRQGPA